MNTIEYDEIIPQMKYFICRYCTPNWGIADSAINFIDLTYIFEGKATYTVNGVEYKAEKGDLICIPRYSQRYAETDSNAPMAAFASNFLLYDINGNEASLPFPIVSKIDVHDDLISMYQELNAEWIHKNAGYAMKVRSIFLRILHRYFSMLYYKDSVHDSHPQIKRAIRFIYDNYKTNIEASDLAAIVGLNPSYFGTLFKKSTGLSVKEFINRVKVDNAENLLSSGEFSVKEVAYRCGFEDNFYFSKVFRKIKGYSPSKVVLQTYEN